MFILACWATALALRTLRASLFLLHAISTIRRRNRLCRPCKTVFVRPLSPTPKKNFPPDVSALSNNLINLIKPVFSSQFGTPESAQCTFNAHCSNSFVFGKNYLNFD
jgi:hypothetical protein